MSALVRIGTTPVYHELLPVSEPAFLLFVAGEAAATLPDTLPTAAAWQDPQYAGWFVVLPAVPSQSLDDVAAALLASGFFAAPPQTGVAWTSYDGKHVAKPQTLALAKAGDQVVVAGDGHVAVGSRYGIILPGGNPVEATLVRDDVVSLAVTYVARSGWPPPNGIGCTIPFTGADRFCLLALGLLVDASDAIGSGSDVAFYFAYTDAKGALQTARYPLLDVSELAFVAALTLDPGTNWWTPGPAPPRTRYRLSGEAYRITASDDGWSLAPAGVTALPSAFRTVAGERIGLAPIDGSLVPQPLPGSPGEWYLTPSGTFALQSNATSPQLMGGLAATERLAFTSGDVITFIAGSPAHAPTYPPPPAGRTNPLLDTATVTAWATVAPTGSTPIDYAAQPKTSALFGLPLGSAASPILPLFNPTTASVEQTSASFPIAPYAGIDGGSAFPFADFERQILLATRQAALTGSGTRPRIPRPAVNGTTATTTPQGFLITAGASWTNLTLASNARTTGEIQTLAADTVTPDLQNALQTNELFLVVTLAEPLALSGNTLPISDWPFEINVGSGGSGDADFANVLIFKYCHGTLLDWASRPADWALASTFNTNPQNVSNWLSNYLQAALGAQANNAAYTSFTTIIQQEQWNGMLALRVDVPLDALPDDLRGLAAGINSALFSAHHLGINATKVTQSGTSFSMPPASSLFGLIDYVDQDNSTSMTKRSALHAAAAANGDPGYSFRVLTLFAEFQNSQIIAFSSRIVLTITRLFAEDAQLQIDSSLPSVLQNAVVLDGTLERRVANDGTSITVYVFRSSGDDRFLLPSSNILNYVDITKCEFHTLKPITGTSVQSEFRMWGFLNFEVIEGLDLFSFGGDPADTQPSGLAYSGLVVAMDFDNTNPQGTLAFHFRPDGVGFDSGASTARAASLFTALPLSLDTIDSSASGKPEDAGYLPVLASVFKNVAALDPSQWFAVRNVLNLGTMGALANLASFDAELVPAWSPGGDKPRIALLIKLPGTSPGKKLMSLQQVVKLEIGSIQLTVDSPAPNLVLSLSFLGIALDFIGLKKLPSGASISLALSRGNGPSDGSLGWLACYSRTAS